MFFCNRSDERNTSGQVNEERSGEPVAFRPEHKRVELTLAERMRLAGTINVMESRRRKAVVKAKKARSVFEELINELHDITSLRPAATS